MANNVEKYGPQVIDVITVFDTETILETYKNASTDPKNPTWCIHEPIYMVTKVGNTVKGNDPAVLTFTAKMDDIIRWRECTIALDSQDYVQLYEFIQLDSNGKPLPPDVQTLISKPQLLLSYPNVPVPNTSDPAHPSDTEQITQHYWQATVLGQKGKPPWTVQYYWRFLIKSKSDGKTYYFVWDPFIKIIA